jgi:hypothetical protein
VPLRRAALLLAALACVALTASCDDRCETTEYESTFGLRDDELDRDCRDVCAEAIDDGTTFERCSRTTNDVQPASVTCVFSLETCDSGGGF